MYLARFKSVVQHFWFSPKKKDFLFLLVIYICILSVVLYLSSQCHIFFFKVALDLCFTDAICNSRLLILCLTPRIYGLERASS